MKKQIVSIMCFALALSLAACGGKTQAADTTPVTTDAQTEAPFIGDDPATWGPAIGTEDVQMPNPWQECTTLEEAGELAGFSFTAPETLDGFSTKYIATIPGDIAQEIFSNGEADDQEVTFRKGNGQQDISGDYNVYETVETRQIAGKDVTVKSTDGLIYTVFWEQDGYSYSVSARTGMTETQMEGWIAALY